MSTPKNLQKPLNIDGQPIYPQTTGQQVIMEDGRRLNAWLEEGKYTLVHDVTTTEDLNGLTLELDNVKKVYISVTTPQGLDISGYLTVNNYIQFVYFEKLSAANNKQLSRATIYVENGMLNVKNMSSMNADSADGTVDWSGPRGFKKTNGGTFADSIFKVGVYPYTNAIPAGTNIKVYEVK